MDSPLIYSSYVRKPTALIHFERELSVVAQKVMTLIVAHCQKATKNDQGFYLIEKREVCEFLGWEESHNYPRVVDAFREIFDNTVVWNLFGQDRTFKRLECKLIVALLIPTEAGRFIGFALYPLLESVILSPKVFGQILFEAPALLIRSEYAFPLYELLADHVSRDDGLLRITLADFKRYLGLKGRYADFTLFVMRVLTPSLDSINSNTDIQVNYETWRTGRGVSGLIFHVQRQSKPVSTPASSMKTLAVTVAAPPARSDEEQTFLERLARHGISEADGLQALERHGLQGARDIFGYVRQEVLQRKGTPEEIRNVPAYLARCLREGYGGPSEMEREIAQERQHQAQHAAAQHAAHNDAQAQVNARLKEQITEAVARWSCLPEAEQAALEQRFLREEPIWALRPADSVSRSKAFQRWLVQQQR